MKWYNLKQNKCPKCEKDIFLFDTKIAAGMIEHRCGFKIRERRFQEIVSSQVNKDLEKKWDEELEAEEGNSTHS